MFQHTHRLCCDKKESHSQDDDNIDDMIAFEFDASASLQQDAREATTQLGAEELARRVVPAHFTIAQHQGVIDHLRQTPVNDMITAEKVVITHVENDEGEEVAQSGPRREIELTDALERAKDANKDLVQFAFNEKNNTAYCRIRGEIEKLLKKMNASSPDGSADGAADDSPIQAADKLQQMCEIEFSDRVDAHFIDWKSKKIVIDIYKGHPVQLRIRKFASVSTAVPKMREFLSRIRQYAELSQPMIPHHHTGISVSDKMISVTLMPSSVVQGKVPQVKHPSENDWSKGTKRFMSAMEASGQEGTFVKRSTFRKKKR